MSAETLPAIERALYERLLQHAGVYGLVQDRIYNALAPANKPMPYVVFYLASGQLPRLTPRLATNDVYRLEAVAASRAEAEQLRAAIFHALDSQRIAIPDFSAWWVKAERMNVLVDTVEGVHRWRYVTDYRVRTSAYSA